MRERLRHSLGALETLDAAYHSRSFPVPTPTSDDRFKGQWIRPAKSRFEGSIARILKIKVIGTQ